MSTRYSAVVEQVLRRAGWHEGRRVDTSPWYRTPRMPFAEAERALAEFSGLWFGLGVAGSEVGHTDIDFRPYEMHPEFSGYPEFEVEIGQKLFPVAQVSNGSASLVVDESGRVYMIHDDLDYYAPSIHVAIEELIGGQGFAHRA